VLMEPIVRSEYVIATGFTVVAVWFISLKKEPYSGATPGPAGPAGPVVVQAEPTNAKHLRYSVVL
jgi:hypothetical protein